MGTFVKTVGAVEATAPEPVGLDLARLMNVRDRGDRITAACPACPQTRIKN
jgi:hypothetical protein